ncbi:MULTISPECIES: phosphatase PAP2 family protein [Streptomyces]|nr:MULTISPECIES: phosphatase PAP2 family protein [Streptomyces]MCZ4099591.1 phosphatase PAP2 family protein [Streptomyces sp. H39-C1]
MRTPDSAASRVSEVDRRLLTALRRCGDGPHVARTARALSWSGEHAALWLAAGVAGASVDRRRRRAWLRATALVGAAHVASMGVKRVVRRPRPRLPGARPLVNTAGRHSFPSSHAASSAAAAVAFGALLPGPFRLFGPFPPLAAGMCAARLVVGVHYPSDVAAGAMLGAATARMGRAWSLRGGGLDG